MVHGMKADMFKAWRARNNKSQSVVAQTIGVSQKKVSNWENGIESIPPWIEERLNEADTTKGEHSASHSWSPAIFESLRRQALKHAKEVTMRAVISPSDSSPDFADYAAEIQFSQLTLNGHRLYLDHIRDPGDRRDILPSSGGFQRPEGDAGFRALILGGSDLIEHDRLPSKQNASHPDEEIVIRQGDGALVVAARDKDHGHIIQMREIGAVRARLQEDQRVRFSHHLAYEIWDADPDDPVSVFMRSSQGFNVANIDAVGYAHYSDADFSVERVRLEVEFRGGLVPVPDPPNARAQLIRRTSVRPNSLAPDFPKPTKSKGREENTLIYRFGPLLRPKGGFLYSLVWAKLDKRTET
jgi:transcriptional regulator with XRE-family HTH domain